MPAISIRGVSKRYRVASKGKGQLKDILSFGKSRDKNNDFWALEDINLDIEPGSTLGILGRNGAGKSTLLRIISGVIQPTSGTVEVNGRMAALFGVGAGFNPEFTGRDNAMLNGLLLGIERDEMLERFGEIEAFADIGKFMDQPVKTYSSGMQSRLGFAVAVNVQPDILVLDETLSVGDAVFKQMGLQKMRDLRDAGTTILFVSHSMGMVRSFCKEAILLHRGKLITSGGMSETLDRYQALISSIRAQKNIQVSEEEQQVEYMIEHEEEEDAEAKPDFAENPPLASRRFRHGTGEAKIQNVEVLDGRHRPAESVEVGSRVTVRVHAQYLKDVDASSLSIILRNKTGLDMFSTSTNAEKTALGSKKEGERVVVDFTFRVPLKPGDYSVTASISPNQGKNLFMDWIDVAAVFEIKRAEEQGVVKGLIHLPTEVEIHEQDSDQDRDQHEGQDQKKSTQSA